MDSPISPILADLFMEEFEKKAISAATNLLRIWERYVDRNNTEFLQHIKSIDPHMQFTAEDPNLNGSISFLDTLITQGQYNTLLITVYSKPTHIDQYLHWDSHHNHFAKFSIFNTLRHRARIVCKYPDLLQGRRII